MRSQEAILQSIPIDDLNYKVEIKINHAKQRCTYTRTLQRDYLFGNRLSCYVLGLSDKQCFIHIPNWRSFWSFLGSDGRLASPWLLSETLLNQVNACSGRSEDKISYTYDEANRKETLGLWDDKVEVRRRPLNEVQPIRPFSYY
jgi:hypothetical protein